MIPSDDKPSTWLPSAPVEVEALLGGRGLQAVGLVSLFLSAAFFFKLAVDHGWLPPVIRVIVGLAVGGTMLVAGAVIHRRSGVHRPIVEGILALGGSLCYLSLWAAGPLFELVGSAEAFGGMSVVTGVLAFLAWRHRSQITALYAVIGGLLTPALLPQSDHRVVLAAYLLTLCAGMLKLAEDRRFRLVAPVAFLGSLAYAPQFATDAQAGWTHIHALAISSSFFLAFGAAFFVAGRRKAGVDTIEVVFGTLNIAAYIGMLEWDLVDHRMILTAALLALGAALVCALVKGRSAKPVETLYLWAVAVAISLAVPAYFAERSWAIAATYTLEGLLLYVFGTFRASSALRNAGLLMTAISAPLGVAALCFQPVGALASPERVATFAVIVLALFGAATLTGAHRYVFPSGANVDFGASAIALANLAAFAGIADVAYTLPAALVASTSLRELITSVVWTAFAAVVFAVAVRRGSLILRWQSLGLFAITIGKVMTIDLGSIDLIDRVAVCFGLGVATLIVSTVYLRRSALTS